MQAKTKTREPLPPQREHGEPTERAHSARALVQPGVAPSQQAGGRGGLSGRVAGCAAVGLGLAAGNADGDMTVVRNGAEDAGGRGAESGTCTTSVRVGTKRGGVLGGGSAISQLSAPSRGE